MSVFVFHGCDHKVGTSTLAESCAKIIARDHQNLEILLIHTEGWDGGLYSSKVGESMDRVKPYLADKLLNADEVAERSRYKDNLHVISGSTNPALASSFYPDMTRYLLESVRDRFDLIICDAGSELERGMPLGALLTADYIYYVVVQNEIALRRYEWLKKLYIKLNINLSAFVINKYEKISPYGKKYIADRFEISDKDLLTVKYTEYGKNVENSEKNILDYKDRGFNRDLESLCAHILSESGIVSVK